MKDEIKTDKLNKENFAMTDEKKPYEVQEKELNDVSGGDKYAATAFYRSGDKPAYEVGQRVKIRTAPYYDVTEYHNVTITAVGGKTGGKIMKEFVYTVRYDNGKIEGDIYESQIEKIL